MMYQAPLNARDENGEAVIPASQRPDGTWRKARRVKEGYVPQEEVPLYESKGKQLQNRTLTAASPLPKGTVPHKSIPGLFIEEAVVKPSAAAKPKSKKTCSTTKPSAAKKPPDITAEVTKKMESASITCEDPEKKLKNLKKRLREVEALEEKIKNGQLAKPEPEQLVKLKRKNHLIYEIRQLEKSLQ